MLFIWINKEKMQIFSYFQIQGLNWFLDYNSPSLILCIVFRHINTEGQGINIAACVMLIKKYFKSLTKGGILENCITLQWKEILNTRISMTSTSLYKHQWGQHQAFWRQQYFSYKFSHYLKTLGSLIWCNIIYDEAYVCVTSQVAKLDRMTYKTDEYFKAYSRRKIS